MIYFRMRNFILLPAVFTFLILSACSGSSSGTPGSEGNNDYLQWDISYQRTVNSTFTDGVTVSMGIDSANEPVFLCKAMIGAGEYLSLIKRDGDGWSAESILPWENPARLKVCSRPGMNPLIWHTTVESRTGDTILVGRVKDPENSWVSTDVPVTGNTQSFTAGLDWKTAGIWVTALESDSSMHMYIQEYNSGRWLPSDLESARSIKSMDAVTNSISSSLAVYGLNEGSPDQLIIYNHTMDGVSNYVSSTVLPADCDSLHIDAYYYGYIMYAYRDTASGDILFGDSKTNIASGARSFDIRGHIVSQYTHTFEALVPYVTDSTGELKAVMRDTANTWTGVGGTICSNADFPEVVYTPDGWFIAYLDKSVSPNRVRVAKLQNTTWTEIYSVEATDCGGISFTSVPVEITRLLLTVSSRQSDGTYNIRVYNKNKDNAFTAVGGEITGAATAEASGVIYGLTGEKSAVVYLRKDGSVNRLTVAHYSTGEYSPYRYFTLSEKSTSLSRTTYGKSWVNIDDDGRIYMLIAKNVNSGTYTVNMYRDNTSGEWTDLGEVSHSRLNSDCYFALGENNLPYVLVHDDVDTSETSHLLHYNGTGWTTLISEDFISSLAIMPGNVPVLTRQVEAGDLPDYEIVKYADGKLESLGRPVVTGYGQSPLTISVDNTGKLWVVFADYIDSYNYHVYCARYDNVNNWSNFGAVFGNVSILDNQSVYVYSGFPAMDSLGNLWIVIRYSYASGGSQELFMRGRP